MDKFSEEARLRNERIQIQNRRLIELNDKKNDLIAAIAHDLKNPISSIYSVVQLMKKNSLSLELSEHLSFIDRTILSVDDILNRALDFSAKDLFYENLSSEVIQLRDTLLQIVEAYQHLAKEKNLQIHVSSYPTLKLLSSRYHLNQIISNVLSNAIKFSPSGSIVRISCVKRGESVFISVEDEGPGIKVEEISLLFKKFSRTSNNPSGLEMSTGLGLYISKKYAEMIGGELTYEPIDKGSRFVLMLS